MPGLAMADLLSRPGVSKSCIVDGLLPHSWEPVPSVCFSTFAGAGLGVEDSRVDSRVHIMSDDEDRIRRDALRHFCPALLHGWSDDAHTYSHVEKSRAMLISSIAPPAPSLRPPMP